MATRARREPVNITLTVQVEFAHDHSERWVRQQVGHPVFMALTRALAGAIVDHVADVERVTVFEPARRNIGAFVERRTA